MKARLCTKGVVPLALAIPLLISACSSGSSSTQTGSVAGASGTASSASSCARAASAGVTAAEKPAAVDPGSSFDATALKGKTLAFVADDMALGIDATTYAGFKAAAASVGATTQSFDGKGQVPGYATAMNEALAQHPAGIVFDAIGPNYINAQLATAKSEGIPTVGLLETPAPNETAYMNVDDAALGKVMADYVLSNTNCNANVVMFDAPSFGTMLTETQAAQAEFSKLCPSCKFRIINQNIAELGTTTTNQASTTLEKDPNVNYMLSAFDAMSTLVVPGIQQTSRSVPLVGSWAQPNTLQWVQNHTVEAATIAVGDDAPDGWGAFDQVARLILKQPASAAVTSIPFQLVDLKDVGTAINYPGYQNYEAKYKAAFGVG